MAGDVHDPDAAIAAWSGNEAVKGDAVAGTNEDGTFTVNGIPLHPGLNLITVQATDGDGQTGTDTVVIEVDLFESSESASNWQGVADERAVR